MVERSVESLAPLADPLRRRLYAFVATSTEPVDRDAAAAAVSISRGLAAFHLDRLAAAGLLHVDYRRRSGRTGPGAGRPAKFYRRAVERQLDVSLPPRRYDLAAEILATAAAASSAGRAAALRAAREKGAAMAHDGLQSDAGANAVVALERGGYEPIMEEDGRIRLRNCPFERLAAQHRDLTCSLNLALISAITDESAWRYDAQLAPEPGWCCVALVPR